MSDWLPKVHSLVRRYTSKFRQYYPNNRLSGSIELRPSALRLLVYSLLHNKDQTVFIQPSITPTTTTTTATTTQSFAHNTMSSGNNADLMAHNSHSGGISTALVYKICQTGARVKPRIQYPPIDDSLDDLCLDLDWEKFVADELGGEKHPTTPSFPCQIT